MLSGLDYSDNRIYQSGWEKATGHKGKQNILKGLNNVKNDRDDNLWSKCMYKFKYKMSEI